MATITKYFYPNAADVQTTAFPQRQMIQGTNFPVHVLGFDAAADEDAFWHTIIEDYNGTALELTFDIYWYGDTASSGDVVFGAQLAAITPNTDTQDVETDSLATADTVTDSHLGTTAQRLHKATITMTNLDSAAAGDMLICRIYRDADNASDTMTGDANVWLVALRYSDD